MKRTVLAGLVAVLGFSTFAMAEETFVPVEVLAQQVDAMDAAMGPEAAFAYPRWYVCEAQNAIGHRYSGEGRSPEQAQRRALDECARRAIVRLCHPTGCRPR